MKLKSIVQLLMKPMNKAHFSQENKRGGIIEFVKSAWKQTFPNEEDQVKDKYQKVKSEKRLTKEQLDKIQAEMPEYLKGAIVETNQKVKEEDKDFKVSSLIPESVKNKIKETEQYKEYTIFKQNLKEYASTREGPVANATSMVYSKVVQGSTEAKATQIMRQYIKDFDIYQLEKESTVLFKNLYHSFLKEKVSEIETMASEQALQFFNGHIKLNKTKKCKPKYTEVIFNYPSQMNRARIAGQKALPSFDFTIKILQIYCMIDKDEKIVDGGDDRVHESIFEFTIMYGGNHLSEVGHPWEIVEVKKLQEMKMLI